MSTSGIHLLKVKLELFVRRYYFQQIIKGSILILGVLSALWLFFAGAAYYFYFSSGIRLILFYFSLGTLLFILGKYILLPLAKLYKIGERLSDQEAAKIIGKHFKNDIDDKLLNAVLLYNSDQNNELILASIEQKTKQLKSFNFKLAVPFSELKNGAKYAAVPLVLFLLMVVWNPKVISQGTQRIVQYQEEFLPENPFVFKFLNDSLIGIKNESFLIKIEFTGSEVPADVYLDLDNKQFRFKKESSSVYSYTVNQLSDDLNFKIKTGIFYSKTNTIKAIGKPALKSLDIFIQHPQYLGGKQEQIKNNGNISVPEGSLITWQMTAEEFDELKFTIGNQSKTFLKGDNEYQFTFKAKESVNYKLKLSKKDFARPLLFDYQIDVIKDAFPEIMVSEYTDSLIPTLKFFSGKISDDYGFTSLYFYWTVDHKKFKTKLALANKNSLQNFNHSINFYDLALKPGDEIEYYFEIKDNDGVNGAKSTLSSKVQFQLPDKSKIDSLMEQSGENVKNQMASALNKSKDLQNQYKEIKRLMLEKPKLDWQDKQKIQNFIQNQKNFENDLLKIQQQNEKNNQQKENLSPQDQEMLQKQEKINELFDQLMDDETKKMFEEIEKLMQELQKENPEKKLEDINLSNENLEKSLDRTLELFKQMEFEQELNKTVSDLKELAKEQQELAKETEKAKNSENESLKQKQEDIKKEFDRLQEKIDNLEEKNQELENKKEFENTEPSESETQKQMQESKENLEKNQKKSSAKNQEKAADEMNKMAQQLQSMQEKMQEEQASEDINAMRQLLKNLIFLSVEQEKLLDKFKKIRSFDPQFPLLTQQQKKLKDDAKVIEDSLLAISKRQVALESIINKEIHEINYNLDKAIVQLADRNASDAIVNQQLVMTSANNLALILDESIQQMQNAMMQQKFGQGSCNKPGGMSPKPGQGMKALQMQLSKQLQEMKKQLEKGNQPGKTGETGKKGEAMGFGKMAAEQSDIKEKLRQLSQQLKNQGNGGLGGLDDLQKEAEKLEKELFNKNITRESIIRQQEILTRLLEAEKSMQEREFDDKRESQKGKNTNKRNPNDFLEYKSNKESQEELLKIVPPSLNIFYKNKVNEYFNTLD